MGVPARRVVGALVEGAHDAQEILQVGPVRGIDVDFVAEPWMALAQSERGVKMPRIKNHQSVFVCGQILVDSFCFALARAHASVRAAPSRRLSAQC